MFLDAHAKLVYVPLFNSNDIESLASKQVRGSCTGLEKRFEGEQRQGRESIKAGIKQEGPGLRPKSVVHLTLVKPVGHDSCIHKTSSTAFLPVVDCRMPSFICKWALMSLAKVNGEDRTTVDSIRRLQPVGILRVT